MERTALAYSSGSRVLSRSTSNWPEIAVSGVRSSWEALAMKCFCERKAVCSLSNRSLKVSANWASSSRSFPVWARWDRLAALIARISSINR